MGNEEHLLEYRGEHHPEARAAPSVVPGGGGCVGAPLAWRQNHSIGGLRGDSDHCHFCC